MTEPQLTQRQFRAIEAILSTDNRSDAASQVGCSERTIRRWLSLPPFAKELRAQRSKLLDETTSVLISGSAGAARVLIAIADGAIKAEPSRVAAARAILDLATRLEESGELADRLLELEGWIRDLKNPPPAPAPWQ